ncbi:CorA Metal Ion Transporter (MIT) Family [Thraustotheca clavata]|uniref:CorA Metal Ion Transporter (MIT) Family n=1 Tax=Thraustotheca clavata TaxID=74557 RepID=A0A1V9Z7G6_9STRA|nr:CorA Metal Ion Transporter (MIT) Family [Thraustotheca clavata]
MSSSQSPKEDLPLLKITPPRYNIPSPTYSPLSEVSTKTSPLPSQSVPTELHLSSDSISFALKPYQHEQGSSPSAKPSALNTSVSSASDVIEDEYMSILDPYFDVTPSRVHLAFDEADPNATGTLTRSGLRQALESLGIRCSDRSDVFDTLLTFFPEPITLTSFEDIVQKLKLGNLFDEGTIALFTDSVYAPARIEVCDFSSVRLTHYKPELQLFFMHDRAPWVSCRFINVQGHDHLNLKRLAIKYRLHPLAMEDTIELNERPKFDSYETHQFAIFPVLRHEIRFPDSKPRESIVHGGFWQYFSGASSKKNSSGSAYEFKITMEHVSIFVVGDNTLITVKPTRPNNIWRTVHRRLASTYSKVRHNRANFLFYTVLDVIVDDMTHVMDLVRQYLMHLDRELAQLLHNFDIGMLRDAQIELAQLPRVIKPTRDVLKSVLESRDIPEATKAYFRDVHDHLNHILDEIEWQSQMCRGMIEEYRDAKATQMNYVMYTLTIVTTVFLPAQFLTGVYGMNFDYMPELHSRLILLKTMTEDNLSIIAYAWIAVAALTHVLLQHVSAPFGRHASLSWGPVIDNKLGWFLMELLSPVIISISYIRQYILRSSTSYAWVLYTLWITHYTNRTLIYPLRISSKSKPMPVLIVLCACGFNLMNAGLNAAYLELYATLYDQTWLSSPLTIVGLLLFICGMYINITSDNILIRLRKPNEKGYKIPHGSFFEYVSCPNLMGECIEWLGFGIVAWNLGAFSFTIWTSANLIPRAMSHHKWYKAHFKEYPDERKAIIPFIY